MIVERAELPIKAGSEAALEAAIPQALACFGDAPGFRTIRCARGIEEPQTYLLLIEWDNVADHIAFTRSPAFDAFKAAIGPHVAGPSRMAHFEPFA